MIKKIICIYNTEMRRTIFFCSLVLGVFALAQAVTTMFFVDVEVGEWFLNAHIVLELITVIIAIVSAGYIFALHQHVSKSMLFLGAILGVSGLLDLLHIVSFPGIPPTIVFPSVNLTLYFWLAARLSIAFGFLVFAATLSIKRAKDNHAILFLAIVAPFILTAIVFWCVNTFYINLPELSYVFGLSIWKIFIEYVVISMFLTAAILLFLQAKEKKITIPYFLLSFLVISIGAEFHFTMYQTILGIHVFWGHVFKVLAYFMLVLGVLLPVRAIAHEEKKDELSFR